MYFIGCFQNFASHKVEQKYCGALQRCRHWLALQKTLQHVDRPGRKYWSISQDFGKSETILSGLHPRARQWIPEHWGGESQTEYEKTKKGGLGQLLKPLFVSIFNTVNTQVTNKNKCGEKCQHDKTPWSSPGCLLCLSEYTLKQLYSFLGKWDYAPLTVMPVIL